MLDHVSFSVSDYTQSLKFYDETLKILGFERLMTVEKSDCKAAGYGTKEKIYFWISTDNHNDCQFNKKFRGFHIAFQASCVDEIHAWYLKCLELGAMDSSSPRHYPEYHAGYYAAHVFDLNGWRLEAVLHNYKV